MDSDVYVYCVAYIKKVDKILRNAELTDDFKRTTVIVIITVPKPNIMLNDFTHSVRFRLKFTSAICQMSITEGSTLGGNELSHYQQE